MAKFDDKVNGNTVSADEYNNMVRASKNLIEDSGQVIDSSNTQQSEAVANYVGSGNFYTDSGVANAYVLSTTGSFKAPTDLVDGLEVRFRTSNPNTGASTINVAGLGNVDIKEVDGVTDVGAGFISSSIDNRLRYDASNSAFIKSSSGLATTTTTGQSLLPQQITISNGTDTDHDIDFTAGNFNFDDGTGQAVATALTKQIDAVWAEGDNLGGLDTGTVAIDTTYHMFAIYNPTTSTSDFLFSASLSSPTLPSGYTKKRRIASLQTDGSSNIRNGNYTFFTGGYRFIYNDNLTDINIGSTPTGSRTLYSLTVPPSVIVITTFYTKTTTGFAGTKSLYITNANYSDDTNTDIRWEQGVRENNIYSQYFETEVDSNSQIGIKGNDADPDIIVYTQGWTEYL